MIVTEKYAENILTDKKLTRICTKDKCAWNAGREV